MTLSPDHARSLLDETLLWVQLWRLSPPLDTTWQVLIIVIFIVIVIAIIIVIVNKEPEETPGSVHGELVPEGRRWGSALAWCGVYVYGYDDADDGAC